jgi:hypothetical protein
VLGFDCLLIKSTKQVLIDSSIVVSLVVVARELARATCPFIRSCAVE